MRYLIKAIPQTCIETEKEPAPLLRSQDEEVRTPVPQIEQTAGNQALQRKLKTASLQPKLRVGSSTDPSEREADRAADEIMRMPESQPRPEPTAKAGSSLQSKPANTTEAVEAVQTRIDALSGSGRPLEQAEKEFFESRFGSDFSGVRLHWDSEAAELANLARARAFTVGQDIFLANGESPASTADTRRLLAHELTHVVQQGRAAPDSSSSKGTLLQRAPASPEAVPQPQTIEPVATESSWQVRVDAAIRSQFGLTGLGMTAGQVRFLAPAAFAARFPASEIESLLLDLFLSPPPGTPVRDILSHHQMNFPASGPTAVSSLRRFIADRMRTGFFEYIRRISPTPAIRHRPDISGPAQPEQQRTERITPRALVAEAVGGVTTTAGPREARRIAVSRPARVETLVHEGCHFYVHSAFRRFANSARYQDRLFGGLRMSSILMEGFAEYFARQVMRANAADFGPIAIRAYDEEVDIVSRFVTTLSETQARQAYFDGNAAALSQLERAIELNVRAYPLLVPDFMLTAPVTSFP